MDLLGKGRVFPGWSPVVGFGMMPQRLQKTIAWLTLCLFAAVTSLDDALHLPIYGSYACPEWAAAIDALGLRHGGPTEFTLPTAVFDSDETCPICKFSGEGRLLAATGAPSFAFSPDLDRPQYASPFAAPRKDFAHGPRAPPALPFQLACA